MVDSARPLSIFKAEELPDITDINNMGRSVVRGEGHGVECVVIIVYNILHYYGDTCFFSFEENLSSIIYCFHLFSQIQKLTKVLKPLEEELRLESPCCVFAFTNLQKVVSDCSMKFRSVPALPSGMEKEEEGEKHLQDILAVGLVDTGIVIPTPECSEIQTNPLSAPAADKSQQSSEKSDSTVGINHYDKVRISA